MYEPPFTRTPRIDNLCMEIAEMVGGLVPTDDLSTSPTLHRELRIKSIHSSLVVEGNSLSEDQVTAILNGRQVLGSQKDILEVQNANRAYACMDKLDPYSLDDLLQTHGIMMEGLVADAGAFRSKNVGVYSGEQLIHAGTPATYVPEVMEQLFQWLKATELHPLLKSCIFHYEFEFIHPFADGNGRTGRLWHTLILSRWRPVLAWLPIESVILRRQQDYYAAIAASTQAADNAPFVTYMLEVIREALLPYCGTRSASELREERILELITQDSGISIPQIAEALGISKSTADRTIASMRESGKIRREGPRHGGRWVIGAKG